MHKSKLTIFCIFFFLSINKIVSGYHSIFYSKPFNKILDNFKNIDSYLYSNDDFQNIINRKVCGESLNHVAGLSLDNTDKDAKIFVKGTIRSKKLQLKLGNVKEKEINIKNIILPIENISSKCINIRQNIKENNSTILCLDNKISRNFWIHSITDAVLCYETKIKGKLPTYKYINKENIYEKEIKDDEINNEVNKVLNENITEVSKPFVSDEKKMELINEIKNEIENDESYIANEEEMKNESDTANKETIEDSISKFNDELKKNLLKEEFEDEADISEKPKGIKLRIGKSKYGYPKIKINKTEIEQFQKEQQS